MNMVKCPELAVIVPTYRERENVRALVTRLEAVLAGTEFEVIFVDDDSPDGTADEVRDLSRSNGRIRALQRIGRRGLSSACVEGVLATSAEFVAVMDGDLQHDESLLPAMLSALRRDGADIAIGTRYAGGGGVGAWSQDRLAMSRLATRISRLIVPASVSDPMSGFFMARRATFARAIKGMSSMGFKVLADLLATLGPRVRVIELPYHFRNRHAGESKLDSLVAWEFLLLVLDKLVGRWVPVRFLSFAVVGATGIGVHLSVLTVLFRFAGFGFAVSQAASTLVAMATNFTLNNILTYRDARLRGIGWLRGLLVFILACSVGAVANVGVASYLFGEQTGWILASLAGIAVGTVWNFSVSSFYAWRIGRR
jgi:dolichol-phosphate mannosyltransferase